MTPVRSPPGSWSPIQQSARTQGLPNGATNRKTPTSQSNCTHYLGVGRSVGLLFLLLFVGALLFFAIYVVSLDRFDLAMGGSLLFGLSSC